MKNPILQIHNKTPRKTNMENPENLDPIGSFQLYKKERRTSLLTSRFNNATWEENQSFRKRNQKIGCIYCTPEPVSKQIPQDTIMFILEMNNDNNKIMGIGMVRNRAVCGKYSVYENGNYNRYVYLGKNHISRENMTEYEVKIMKFFDTICFTGNYHMKRGQGLRSFPLEILYTSSKKIDLVQCISEMFKRRIQQKKEIQC